MANNRITVKVDECPICGEWIYQDKYAESWGMAKYIKKPVLCCRCEYENRQDICTRCSGYKPGDVEQRYSFGVYAGRLCSDCCRTYQDHCGLDGFDQGDPGELDEPY